MSSIKGTCEVCGKSPRVLTAIESGQQICRTCLKELRPPRPRHLATLGQIQTARELGFGVADDISREECRALIDNYYKQKHDAIHIERLQEKVALHGVTVEDWLNEEAKLQKQLGCKPKAEDVAWGCYNLAATRATTHEQLSNLYWDMAYILFREGRGCFDMRKRAAIEKLKAMKQESVGHDWVVGVQVLGSCTPSNKLNGRIFSFDEAISDPPIPYKDCDRDGKPGRVRSWCACCFVLSLKK